MSASSQDLYWQIEFGDKVMSLIVAIHKVPYLVSVPYNIHSRVQDLIIHIIQINYSNNAVSSMDETRHCYHPGTLPYPSRVHQYISISVLYIVV